MEQTSTFDSIQDAPVERLSKEMEHSQKKTHLPATPAMPQEQLPPHYISLRELSDQRHRYIVWPEFQRQQIWTIRQEQGLIDSILLGDTVMPPEGYQEINAQGEAFWGIIDGHQRISAILDYMDGKFKTWSHAQKHFSEPNSDPPVEPGKFFLQLDPIARNYFWDYRLQINKVRKRSMQQLVTRYLRIQTHIPPSAAEKLIAYPSLAKEAAKRIAGHQFWEDFYEGDTRREQVFQCALNLIALELAPEGIVDVQSTSALHMLASGLKDALVTPSLEAHIMNRLDKMSVLFNGVSFTERAISIIMYQAVGFIETQGRTISGSDKGRLASWLEAAITETRSGTSAPGYRRPAQKLSYATRQRSFWDRHLGILMAIMGIHKAA